VTGPTTLRPSLAALRGPAVLPDGRRDDAVVVVAGDELLAVVPLDGAEAEADGICAALLAEHGLTGAERLAPGELLLPGLVDLHCHGGSGFSFPDARDRDEARAAAAGHLAAGTTSLVASLVTASAEHLVRQSALLAGLCDDGTLAAIHLEGPFLSPARCGAQDPASMQRPSVALVEAVAAAARGHLATMTLAPEAEGADDVLEALAAAGAVPSIGHTDADAARTERSIDLARSFLGRAGARSPLPTATHLFNGMRPIHHRDPGPVLACLDAAARGDLVVEVIGDGVHTSPDTIRYVFDLAAEDRVVLVTDAMAAAGMEDGAYVLGGQAVTVRDGVARLAHGGSIAGGTTHLVDQLRIGRAAGVPLDRLVRAASSVPARVLGRQDRIGAIAPGLRADLLVVDEETMEPRRVWRGGRRVR
jgi:N-acetylglucosamine-6-phosphate deacetylase